MILRQTKPHPGEGDYEQLPTSPTLSSSDTTGGPSMANPDNEEDGFKSTSRAQGRALDDTESEMPLEMRPSPSSGTSEPMVVYRVYKRRWFGLIQLVLLNVIVSWDWLSFSAVSTTSAQYFNVSESAINWLSTSFLFSFCVIAPLVIYTLNRGGPKHAIIAASVLILLGNWIRFAGTRATGGHFGVVMFGQILVGLAQPFVLSAPTRYSDLWFTPKGRVSATAIASLANPFGGALGQLIDPVWATKPSDIPNMVLYIAIIASIATIPSFFIPSGPPTPPCPSAAESKIPLRQTWRFVLSSVEFWLIFIPFAVYVALFNAISTLLNQILAPHGYSETAAGICGALLIVVGLVTSAITSPLLDRYPHPLFAIKLQVPLIAASYLAFVWAPDAGDASGSSPSLGPPYAVAALLGAACFSLVPIVLELLAEVTHPVSPGVTSTLAWGGGQLFGGIFLVIEDALKDSTPPFGMRRALVFQAVIASLVVPLPLCLGLFGRKVRRRREEVDKGVASVQQE
ncbi:MAG: ubiquinol--cytochrome-c reductase subunit 6 [Chaenotheca gracillima]|nr:MAG: ubiquinol--cytochrome-c reductase subunit 6 [Chaenotheca gracillima]